MDHRRLPVGHRLLALLCLGLAIATLSACGGGEDEPRVAASQATAGPQRGGTAVLGSVSDVDSWNPYLSQQAFANNLLRRIFLRLATPQADEEEHPQTHAPQLADSWSFGADGLQLTFVLREASWSDGKPITAADVRYTWLAQTATAVPWANVATKRHITDVQVVDERTVTFHFDRSYPYQLADAVEGGILPEHVYSAVPFDGWKTHDWSQVRVGSGPFLLARHDPGQQIVLERNPHYYESELPVARPRRGPRRSRRRQPDHSAPVGRDRLPGGAVAGRRPSPEADRGDVAVVSFDYPNYDFIGWNGSRPPFDDPDAAPRADARASTARRWSRSCSTVWDG